MRPLLTDLRDRVEGLAGKSSISSSSRATVGAGSFGAPSPHRPESVPRPYNLLTIPRDFSKMRVDTRCLRRPTGAWEARAVWPGENPGERRSFYEVPLG